jgi:hypothetical protein
MSNDVRRVSGTMGAVAEIKALALKIEEEAKAGFDEVRESLAMAREFVAEHVSAARELRAFMAPETNHAPTVAALDAEISVRGLAVGDALGIHTGESVAHET